MKNIMVLAALMMMVGCVSRTTVENIDFSNKRLVITTNPTATYPLSKGGNEFAYAFSAPAGLGWEYMDSHSNNKLNSGRISWGLKGVIDSGADFSWSWLDAQNKQQLIDRKSTEVPWYTGVTAKLGRIAYVPNESDKVNWNRSGYPQTLWEEDLWVGQNKRYYCGRSIVRRGHETAYLAQQGISSIVNYSYGYGCYFRYTDGRDGLFNATTGWNLTSQELAANPNIVEERIAAFDKTLGPVWDTLEFNPMAYQFDLPK